MGLGDRIREATQMANSRGEGHRFNQIITSLPSRKVEDFCNTYILAGGFSTNFNRNSTQAKYYKELKKYL